MIGNIMVAQRRLIRRYPYRSRIVDVRGRGGTDLQPVFEAEFLRKHRPDIVLYFTDGYGPAPNKDPGIPVIWVVYSEQKPANWGRIIEVSVPKTSNSVPF